MTLIVFLILLGIGAYPLLVYPLLVKGIAAIGHRKWKEGLTRQSVAFVVTVHNEEHRIRQKLDNSMELLRPEAEMTMIVTSDGSTDATREIIDQYPGVVLVECPRRGKGFAQRQAVQATSAEIIVFSDVSTMIEPDGLIAILRPFADSTIGAVSGVDASPGPGGSGEQLYLEYEAALRRDESFIGSAIGLSGCFFAVRREVALKLLDNVDSDLGAALVCLSSGYRAVSQDSARCTYRPTVEASAIYRRWRRTALRGIQCLWAYRRAISWRRPLASWQIVSHKWLRFLSPLFLVAALAAAIWAACLGERWAILTIMSGSLLLLIAMVAPDRGIASRRLPIARPVGFFVLMNLAVLAAWIGLLAGSRDTAWTPTPRA